MTPVVDHREGTATYHVRRARPDDVEAAAAVLAEAFENYPWTTWTVDPRDHSQRLRTLYGLVLERVAVPYGATWVCETRAENELVGVAGWLTPSTDPPVAVWHQLADAEADLRGNRLQAHEDAEAQLAEVRPCGPHWLLGTVGVLPAHRGRGLAARVLRPGLDAAAAEGAAALLETSDPANVRLYQRLGFEVFEHVQVAGGGPTVWLMRRPSPAPRA